MFFFFQLQVHSNQACRLAPLPWFPWQPFPTVGFTPSVRVLHSVKGKCCLSIITEIVLHSQALWKGLRTPHSCNHHPFWASLVAQTVKNLRANAGDPGSIPGLGRFSGEGNDSPLQYSCLENSMDREAWGYSPWGHKESDTTERLTYIHRLVIAFLPRNKHLLISWLQSPSAVILKPPQNKVSPCFHCFPIYLPWSDGTGCQDLSFLNVELWASFFTLLFHPHQETL